MPPVAPPPGFRIVESGSRSVFVREDAHDAALALGFLAGVPASEPCSSVLGRAVHQVYDDPMPHDADTPPLIWKHCRRGGLAGRVLGDRFYSTRRFVRELEAHEAARRAGVAVGDLLAVAITRRRDISHRVEQLIRIVPGARDTAAWLSDSDLPPPDRHALVRAVADVIRSFHDAGLRHGDLNLRNILVRRSGPEFSAILIDLDPAPPLRRGAHTPTGNLARLFRSWCRGRRRENMPLPSTDRWRFLDRYARGDRSGARDHWHSIRRAATRGGWLEDRARSR